jgi:hypothetical protein
MFILTVTKAKNAIGKLLKPDSPFISLKSEHHHCRISIVRNSSKTKLKTLN